jgi:hypothetical protein
VFPTQNDAQAEVFDLLPTGLQRSISGMLGGYIETAAKPAGLPNAVVVGGQPSFGSFMYQPEPYPQAIQPPHSSNPGAYGGKPPAALPSVTLSLSTFAKPLNLAQLSDDILNFGNLPPKTKGKKRKTETELVMLDQALSGNSAEYKTIRDTHYLKNARQGGRFVAVLGAKRRLKASPLDKADLSKAVLELAKLKEFGTVDEKNTLLKLPFDNIS